MVVFLVVVFFWFAGGVLGFAIGMFCNDSKPIFEYLKLLHLEKAEKRKQSDIQNLEKRVKNLEEAVYIYAEKE